jgi:hypothetical protein
MEGVDMKSIETEGMNRHGRAVIRAALLALLNDKEAMSRLYSAAKTYVRDAAIVHEMVWDVIGDVQLGDLTCDLASDLGSQLERKVRRRAKRARRDAARLVFVSLDEAPTDALIIDAELDGTGVGKYKALDITELVGRIRELACEDDAVLQLLGHYERGLTTRRKVLGAGMTQWVYRAARERLIAYADKAASAARSAASVALAADGQDRS